MTNGDEKSGGGSGGLILKILGCGCLLIVLGVGGCFGYGYYKVTSSVDTAHTTLPERVSDPAKKTALKEKIEQVQAMEVDSRMTLGTAFLLFDAATDGTLTDAQYDELVKFLDEVISSNGKVTQAFQNLSESSAFDEDEAEAESTAEPK